MDSDDEDDGDESFDSAEEDSGAAHQNTKQRTLVDVGGGELDAPIVDTVMKFTAHDLEMIIEEVPLHVIAGQLLLQLRQVAT